MSRIACFFIEPTDRVRQKLRRYTQHQDGVSCPSMPSAWGYHNAEATIEDAPVTLEDDVVTNGSHYEDVDAYAADPRWPTHCACGYEFTQTDSWQLFCERIFRRADTGEEMTLRDAAAGAMWYSPWMEHFTRPQLAHPLMVKLPDGVDWCIDSRANNCTLPDDNTHHCWVIDGTEPPHITAGKSGPTCGAGAGSIATPGYHGFLRDGYLESV